MPAGDGHGEGVGNGAHDAQGRAHLDDTQAHQGVIARRQQHRDQHREEGQRLLLDAEGSAGKAEDQHQNRDQQLLPALELADGGTDGGVNGAGLHDHSQISADDQGVENDVHRIHKALDGGHDDGTKSLGIGIHMVEGPRDRLQLGGSGVHVVIGSAGQDPAEHRHQHHNQHDDDVRGRDLELFLFHSNSPL